MRIAPLPGMRSRASDSMDHHSSTNAATSARIPDRRSEAPETVVDTSLNE